MLGKGSRKVTTKDIEFLARNSASKLRIMVEENPDIFENWKPAETIFDRYTELMECAEAMSEALMTCHYYTHRDVPYYQFNAEKVEKAFADFQAFKNKEGK
jgi:hypothetical protein